MAKSTNKTETSATPETTETPETKEEMTKTTAIKKAPPTTIASIGAGDDAFTERWGGAVERVAFNLPTLPEFKTIIDALPAEYAANLKSIVRKAMGAREGVFGPGDQQADWPELRVYQGTGTDPNRPDKQIPGEFYLTTKETVGDKFEGAVLALWEGRTMWGDPDAGESTKMPMCHSMDRIMGSLCGPCDDCPHFPWRDNQRSRCADDVVAFMLSKDMKDIVLVRFAKTSCPAGTQLRRLSGRGENNWDRWFTLTIDPRTSPTDKSHRWYVLKVEPSAGAPVPTEIHEFCRAMCTSLQASYILPNLASIYRSGQVDAPPADGGAGSAPMLTEDSDTLDNMSDDVNV